MMANSIFGSHDDASYIRGLLDYNTESGLLTWKVDRSKLTKAGSLASTMESKGYMRVKLAGKHMKAHRVAWLHVHGEWPNGDIDHINGARSDNRICNLRIASREQNTRNIKKHADGKSPYKGVTLHKQSQKWQAQLGGVLAKYLGIFSNPDDAAKAYDKAALAAYGEFANTNKMIGLLK